MNSVVPHTQGSYNLIDEYALYQLTYDSFGVPAVLLELVPVLGIFFAFTNTVGAALWAADMEQKNQSGEDTTAPNLRAQTELAKKSE